MQTDKAHTHLSSIFFLFLYSVASFWTATDAAAAVARVARVNCTCWFPPSASSAAPLRLKSRSSRLSKGKQTTAAAAVDGSGGGSCGGDGSSAG